MPGGTQDHRPSPGVESVSSSHESSRSVDSRITLPASVTSATMAMATPAKGTTIRILVTDVVWSRWPGSTPTCRYLASGRCTERPVRGALGTFARLCGTDHDHDSVGQWMVRRPHDYGTTLGARYCRDSSTGIAAHPRIARPSRAGSVPRRPSTRRPEDREESPGSSASGNDREGNRRRPLDTGGCGDEESRHPCCR